MLPTRWLAEASFYTSVDENMAVPDPDATGMESRGGKMKPGDAVAFNCGTLQGARGTTVLRRRAFLLRLVGDDARFVEPAGPTSLSFPGIMERAPDKS